MSKPGLESANDLLTVTVEHLPDGTPVLHCQGEIEYYTDPLVRGPLGNELREGHPSIIIDLTDTTYAGGELTKLVTMVLCHFQKRGCDRLDHRIGLIVPKVPCQHLRLLEATGHRPLVQADETLDAVLSLLVHEPAVIHLAAAQA